MPQQLRTIFSLVIIGLVAGFAHTSYALEYQGRLMKLGTHGDDVQALQTCLASMGYPTGTAGADGWYGVQTFNQVSSYQASHGLTPDGVVGPKTITSLSCLPEPVSSETSALSNEQVRNTSAMVGTSSEGLANDTAIFSFKMNLSPLGTPLYLPTDPEASGTIVITDEHGTVVTAPLERALTSRAPIVTGADGNDYFEVSEKRSFTFVVGVRPGSGTYRGQLVSVSFTGDDVLGDNYTSFHGVRLSLDPEVWTTDGVALEN